MTPKEADDMRCIEQQCCDIIRHEFTADNLPLGARRITKSENALHIPATKNRPYRVSANFGWSELIKLERLVYTHASTLSHFLHLLANGSLIVARKKNLDRVFRDEINKMLRDSIITDEEPDFDESDEE